MPRMNSTGVAAFMAVGAGLAGSVQVAVMGKLGDRVGTLEAIAFTFVVTAVLGALILLVAGRGLGGYAEAFHSPKWLWLGGMAGVFIVLAITVSGPAIGTTATVALLIAGQLAAATVIDRFGWFGIDRVSIGWVRLLGLALLVVGAALTMRK